MQIAHTIHQEKNWMKLNGNVEQLVWKWSYLQKWNRQFKVKEEPNFRKKPFIPTNIYLGMTSKYYMLNCFFETELFPKCYGRTDGQADGRQTFCPICSRFNTYTIETKTIPKKCKPLVCRKNAGYEAWQ